MKILLVILAILFVAPIFAQTYSETEFIVEGETRTTPVTTTGTSVAPTTTTVVTTTTEAPIYVGMGKYHVIEVMGQPTYVEKFRKIRGRQQGIYDEVWTYQTPTGTTYVYIKERRVLKIEYR